MAADPAHMSNTCQNAFRNAMRRFANSVSSITTRENDVRRGMTATSVSSVCMEPPSLLMCVNRIGAMHQSLCRTRIACVNLLDADQEALCGVFSRPGNAEQRFDHGRWESDAFGMPYLVDAQANITVRLTAQM